MTKNNRFFDVCIMCALAEEAKAVLEVISRRCGVSFEQGYSTSDNYEYRYTMIQNNKGESLLIHVSWPPDNGPLETSLHFKPVLKESHPRFVAMTGICAGDKRKVKLGDLVIVDRAFIYDNGKIVIGEDGQREPLHDVKTYNADPSVLQAVRLFDSWKPVVTKLKRPSSMRQQREWLLSKLLEEATPQLQKIDLKELEKHVPDWRKIVQELQGGPGSYLTKEWTLKNPSSIHQLRYGKEVFPFKDPPQPESHIAPMASGSAVRSDNPFKDVQIPVRGTVAIDMEGAAFYRTVEEFSNIRSLLVKGVCDYADKNKDDTYHRYASLVSATYILCFIQEYVTEERMPGSREYQPYGRESPFLLWNVPYRRNPFFTGREDLLEQLHEKLTATKAAALTQPQAISGLGGVGKTQIAVEYAYRYRDDYRYILWVRAATRDILTSDFVALADMLRLPEKDEQDQNQVVMAVRRWLAIHDRWLLIFDNADDLDIVPDFLPTGDQGHILFTTRAQTAGTIAQSVEVEKMGMAEGTLLLLRRTKVLGEGAFLDQASEEDLAGAEAIVIELDFLPLALDQAGAYIDEVGCSFFTYLDLYQTHRKQLLLRRGTFPTDHPEPVATTWSLSFHKVEQANPAAADLLRLFAFLEPDVIPEELLIEGASNLGPTLKRIASDTFKLNEAIGVLRKFSLARRNADTKALSIHRLVQNVLKDDMKKQARRRWAERVVRTVNHVFPSVEVETWPRCHRYLPQAQACAQLIENYHFVFPEAARLLNQSALYLKNHALYAEAERLYLRSLAIYEQQFGSTHLAMAPILSNLAGLYKIRSEHAKAEPLYLRALMICEQELGSYHHDTSTILSNLAELYRAQGEHDKAEPLYLRSLAICEQELGSDHSDTATGLNNLAELYRDKGEYAKAEPLYLRALTICEQLGSTHPNTASTLNNLAALYDAQGEYAKAEPLCLRALTICEQQLGPDHPEVAQSLNNLAALYDAQGKYAEAEPLYLRALAIYKHLLGPEDLHMAESLNNLAELYRVQGKYTEAEPLYQQALTICEQQLGPNHSYIAISLNNLALLYDAQDEYAKAEPLYQRVLTICKQQFGDDHPNSARALANYMGHLQLMPREYEVLQFKVYDTDDEPSL